MAHLFGRAARVAVFVAAWSGVATTLPAQTREAPARVSPQDIAISLHEDGQRATVRARGASVRAVLAALAEHARFRLVNLDRVPDITLDLEFVDASVARIAVSLLRDAGVDYLALSGPTELTLKTLVVAGVGSVAGAHTRTDAAVLPPPEVAAGGTQDAAGPLIGLSRDRTFDAPTREATDQGSAMEGWGTTTTTETRVNVPMGAWAGNQTARIQDVVMPGLTAPAGPPVSSMAWPGTIDDVALAPTGRTETAPSGSGGSPLPRAATPGFQLRPGVIAPPQAVPIAAGTPGRVTPEEAIAGITHLPLGAGNARTMTGTISGPVPMTGPPPGTPAQSGVTVPNPAAASPPIR